MVTEILPENEAGDTCSPNILGQSWVESNESMNQRDTFNFSQSTLF